MVGANDSFNFLPPAALGTEHSVTSDRFQEAKLQWPLSGNEFWKASVASVPFAVIGNKWKLTFADRSRESRTVVGDMKSIFSSERQVSFLGPAIGRADLDYGTRQQPDVGFSPPLRTFILLNAPNRSLGRALCQFWLGRQLRSGWSHSSRKPTAYCQPT